MVLKIETVIRLWASMADHRGLAWPSIIYDKCAIINSNKLSLPYKYKCPLDSVGLLGIQLEWLNPLFLLLWLHTGESPPLLLLTN